MNTEEVERFSAGCVQDIPNMCVDMKWGAWVRYDDYVKLANDHSTAINALQDIAAMGRKAGSETARHTLCQLGIDAPDYGSMV
jgi:hypothetical protein